ncbi:disease resistance protein L6-like [Cornus florida]|uniref:disease resistance protein L6-like n=1 Tax=Cornus florida TaxID=4283 RepID=UPI0028A205CF|nr:disease resistance protein L6-like [Cornus florida]
MKIEGDPNEYGVFSTITTTTHHLSQEDEYQVFLNFRGFDTRLNFTDFLYIYLENNGVRTFRDSNKLHIGEKIGPKLLKSIRKSKISIPIFSKNYASSKWFYDVQPSDLKDKDGIYAKALRELQESESLDDETIEQWKEALRVVAGLKGMDVEKQPDGRHAFGRKLLPEECDSISEEVASTAAGLPLALEHTGSFLSDKDPAIWQDILKKLKKKLHDKVEKRFRESYEALNNDQKQIFLDISCLFDGTDKATVFYVWGDCGYHPKIEFNVLSLLL